MNFIVCAKIKSVRYFCFISWICQKKYLYIASLFRKHKNISTFAECNKSLILIPHSDDEWIGCSRLILNKIANGFFFNFSGKDKSHSNKALRVTELGSMSKEMNFHFFLSKDNAEQELFDYLKNNTGCSVFLPSFIDWNIEHLQVNFILQKVLCQLLKLGYPPPSIYLYQVSVPLPFNWINAYLPLDKNEQIQKWAIFFKYYISQSNLPIDRYKIQEQINGSYCKCYAAECFCRMDYEQWNLKLNVLKNKETSLSGLQTKINDIISIHRILNSIAKDENWNS